MKVLFMAGFAAEAQSALSGLATSTRTICRRVTQTEFRHVNQWNTGILQRRGQCNLPRHQCGQKNAGVFQNGCHGAGLIKTQHMELKGKLVGMDFHLIQVAVRAGRRFTGDFNAAGPVLLVFGHAIKKLAREDTTARWQAMNKKRRNNQQNHGVVYRFSFMV